MLAAGACRNRGPSHTCDSTEDYCPRSNLLGRPGMANSDFAGRRGILFGIGCLWLSLLVAMSASAQTSRVGGTLAGTVSDTSGARITGVHVQLRQVETNQVRSLQTDEQGIFQITDLPVGTYEVRCTQAGFAPYLHIGVIV